MSWYQKAQRLHGHPSATGGPVGSVTHSDDSRKFGVVIHSADGYRGTMESLIQGTAGPPSWHISIWFDGTVVQHYDSRRIPWHCGTRPGNRDHFGIELEGRGNAALTFEPITDEQISSLIDVLVWLAKDNEWPTPVRWGVGLKDHNDIVATTCPDGRLTFDIRNQIGQGVNNALNPTEPVLTEEEKDNLMLSKTIVGLDGQAKQFPVLGPNLVPVQRSLTYGQYLTLDALGFLIRPGAHTHTASPDGGGTVTIPRLVLDVQYQ